ncbi:3,4-dihydroxy-2-butanone-4-phosphate synthase [Canibacter zhoujuaniae]|uniref:3,4-dihydroxy-2-butanone-4-phosphate synthase n=1 Tax=Canibacter zhoujuaniae TaxID=2708343 RepID=UPI00142132A0|nr:3,4-dihydroxy-2-butanone-4-phosphate synthase [Canibacter zhoujuaniae]
MPIAEIPEVLEALRAGKPVIVADDEDRENEGDVILSAELATQEWVAWTVKHSSGLLCAPMTNEIADQLDLPMMVERNEDARSTAYTVTVDAAEGVTTGISAKDRMTTLRVLANPEAKTSDVNRPGHILPLRAVDGGVRERAGHTEASVELMRLAGLRPVAAIAEIVADDGEMMRLPELLELGEREGVPVTTIERLIAFLTENDAVTGENTVKTRTRRVSLKADTLVPTKYGDLRMLAFRDRHLGVDHIAVVGLDADGNRPGLGATVRVHSECLTGEALGSLKCECGPQLDAALQHIAAEGGVVLYMRGQEGRGIGLANKMRAYALQEEGFDTVDANLQLGLPADNRDYAPAAHILHELGVNNVRLLTNNTDKIAQLAAHGITVTERVPLIVAVGDENRDYMAVKRDRMQHTLPQDLGGN